MSKLQPALLAAILSLQIQTAGFGQQSRQPVVTPGQVGYGKQLRTMPADFPVQMPSGATLVSAEEVVAKRGRAYYVRWRLKTDMVQTVHSFTEQLKLSGWQLPPGGVLPDVRGHATVRATRRDGSLTIKFAPTTQAGAKTDIIINANIY